MDAAASLPDAQVAVELVTIGDELLLGETVDGNSAWLGRRLAAAGIRVTRRATVGDDRDAIVDAVRAALARVDVVLCTGGLGPTHDDLTRPAVASLFGRDLRVDDAVLESIRARFRSRGVEMAEINRIQAEVPEGARVFPNSRGTAPGLALVDGRKVVVLLPGVPGEMRALMDEHVLPFLAQRWPVRAHPLMHRVVRTTGIAESRLAERLAHLVGDAAPLTVAFLPDVAGVDLRITSWGALPQDQAEAAFDRLEARIRDAAGAHVYGVGDADIAAAVASELTARSLTLAVAESCTGGLVAKRLTDRSGASAYLLGGVVAYANEMKTRLLAVSAATLATHGAVSEETVREMARGACSATGADAGIAVTGIAGPDGGTADKPVGTVWLAAALGERVEARRYCFGGDRDEVRERSAQAVLALLHSMLLTAGSHA